MKDKPTLPITMKKQDMIEEYETLYHNYKGKEIGRASCRERV